MWEITFIRKCPPAINYAMNVPLVPFFFLHQSTVREPSLAGASSDAVAPARKRKSPPADASSANGVQAPSWRVVLLLLRYAAASHILWCTATGPLPNTTLGLPSFNQHCHVLHTRICIDLHELLKNCKPINTLSYLMALSDGPSPI